MAPEPTPVQFGYIRTAWSLAERATPITLMFLLIVSFLGGRYVLGELEHANAAKLELFRMLIAEKDIRLTQAEHYSEALTTLYDKCRAHTP